MRYTHCTIMNKNILLFLTMIMSCLKVAGADMDPKIAAIHNDLRALRDGLMDAINKGDIERELTYLDTNVVITWHNAEVSRGREGVRAYYNRLTGGPNKLVEKFSGEVKVDELTILYGENTGISFGSSVEHFVLTGGRKFDLNGRWTATLVKDNGKWLIASLHVSTNIFDNAMLDLEKKRAFEYIVVALVLGVSVGFFWGLRRRIGAQKPKAA